jgi:hypothetical protein
LKESEKKFIQDIILTLIENQVTVKLDASPVVGYKHKRKFINCDGWFNEEVPELVCGIKKSTEIFIMVLGHEYSHYRQWKENSPHCLSGSVLAPLDDFIIGKKISEEKINRCIDVTRDMELDCEKRNIELMARYNLGYDMKRMIQRANSYIFFYTVLLQLKAWYTTAPYLIKNVVDVMPDEFLPAEAYKIISKNYIDLYRQYCLKSGEETEIYAA